MSRIQNIATSLRLVGPMPYVRTVIPLSSDNQFGEQSTCSHSNANCCIIPSSALASYNGPAFGIGAIQRAAAHMKPEISSPPAAYLSSYHEVFDRQEGSRSPDPCSNPQTPTPRWYSIPPEDDAVPASEYAVRDTTHGYPPWLDTHDSVPGSARIIVLTVERDGTVVKVHGPPLPPDFPTRLNLPPLSQEGSRVAVPQLPYECGNTQKKWSRKPPILCFTYGRQGVKLLDAVSRRFKGMDDRDDFPFDMDTRGITIRIHFPGYPSSTDVEKMLKQQAGRLEVRSTQPMGGTMGGTRARSMQLSTRNYRANPDPVTKSKLVQEVSKRIRWHIEDLEEYSDLFPFDDQVGEKWRLGQGQMKFEHMFITRLDNVSSGSWSPVICIE